MAGPPNKGYKRSWKNLLINKRYQLRFTLFMVGLSALLMAGLGLWVMKEANDATSVAKSSIAGDACPKVPVISDTVNDDGNTVPLKLDGEGSAVDTGDAPSKLQHSAVDPKDVAHHNANDDVIAVQNAWCLDASCKPEQAAPLEIKMSTAARCDAYVKKKLNDADAVAALRAALVPVVKCEGGGSYTVADAAAAPGEHHVKVQLDESSMTMTPAPPSKAIPPDYGERLVAHWACVYRNEGKIQDLEAGRLLILWVLVVTGLALVLGLAIYGIKMTHRVAGPLFKVSLYLAKMKDGRYDKVWNLRKGDQLVEFYDHFKAAHAGVVALERGDIDQMKALIAAAKDAGAGDSEAVKDLEALVARKEKALE
ncbi:MAG TPA: hypothetical protein VFQ65_16745 [Kofleriaceae bacterium]|nr:hypothetical protein [Kofleriaceae bacterium]